MQDSSAANDWNDMSIGFTSPEEFERIVDSPAEGTQMASDDFSTRSSTVSSLTAQVRRCSALSSLHAQVPGDVTDPEPTDHLQELNEPFIATPMEDDSFKSRFFMFVRRYIFSRHKVGYTLIAQ